jgi:RHS repeat-associated protein
VALSANNAGRPSAIRDSLGNMTRYAYDSEQFLFNQSRIKRYYYHRDHQNSILALSDENAQIVEYYEYDIYGTITKSEKIAKTLNPYRYTGREYDTDDLYYYRARYYDPTIGRFITPDPIGFLSGDTNFYRYVGNDPVNFVDYSGFSAVATGGAVNHSQQVLSKTATGTNPTPPKPKPSNGGGASAKMSCGVKVAGTDMKIEPNKILYFIFYVSTGSKNDEKFHNAAKKRYDAIVQEINKKKDAKNHLAFLVKANSKDAMTNYVRQKVEANGGKKKAFIGSIEGTTELIKGNSLFDRIQKSIKVDTNAFKPTPYFNGKIDQSSIDAVNQNILRNEAHNKLIMSPEHQKYVYKMMADDCDSASTKLGGAGAAIIAISKFLPAGYKVVGIGIGETIGVVGIGAGGLKHVFNYLADDFKKEELITDIILEKTVYVKNEFAEFVYDEAFSAMAEYFYEK